MNFFEKLPKRVTDKALAYRDALAGRETALSARACRADALELLKKRLENLEQEKITAAQKLDSPGLDKILADIAETSRQVTRESLLIKHALPSPETVNQARAAYLAAIGDYARDAFLEAVDEIDKASKSFFTVLTPAVMNLQIAYKFSSDPGHLEKGLMDRLCVPIFRYIIDRKVKNGLDYISLKGDPLAFRTVKQDLPDFEDLNWLNK